MSEDRYVWRMRIILHELKSDWNQLSDQQRAMKIEPLSKCDVKRSFDRVLRGPWHIRLQHGPVRLICANESSCRPLSAVSILEIADEHFEFMTEKWARDAIRKREHFSFGE